MKREYIITYEEAYADGVYFAHPIGELGQEIIRCGECKYYDKFPTWSACTYWSGDPYEQASVNFDDFCSYGERRE